MKTLSTQLSSITAPLRAFVALVLISAGAFLGAPPALAAPGSQLYYWDVTGQALVDTMTNHPPSLTNAVAIAMGYQHVLALRADGKVVGWGNNQVGQTNVPPDLSGVVTIGAGRFHSAAVTAGGRLVLWGIADTTFNDYPPPGLENVATLACGTLQTIALMRDGTVGAWGPRTYNYTNFTVGLSNITGIGAGSRCVLAIRSNGTVVDYDGSFHSPPLIATNVIAVTGGDEHRLALRADGTVVAWTIGSAYYGEDQVPAAATNVVAIAAQWHGSAALRADGTVIAWGADGYGTPMTNPPSTPFILGIGISPWCSLALANPTAAAVPVIVSHPKSQSVTYGSSVTLSVGAVGWGPLHYQWYLNGDTALGGATNRFLTFTNIQFTQAGSYSARVGNIGGFAYSQAAQLGVVTSMQVDMVPRVRVVGQTGLHYQIDYLNAFGNPSAWMPLTNILLNTSPFYLIDESAVGQPSRFYRSTPGP